MRKVIVIGVILLTCSVIYAQERMIRIDNKIFNFGATVGLKSSLPIINVLKIDGVEADNIQTHYSVGYTGSIFCRINMDRLFLQPSLAWHHSTSEIRFAFPDQAENLRATDYHNTLKMTFESIEIPVLLGYKVIKEGPYGLSLMAGPQFKYAYKTDYDFQFPDSQNRFAIDNNSFDINIVMGVGVSIWRLFFDFKYEFGLNKMDSDFRNLTPSETELATIEIGKRINVMSFSLGLLF